MTSCGALQPSPTNFNGPTGAGAKARYEDLKAFLTERYGKGYSSETLPKNPETQAPDKFVSSLHKCQRSHYTNWRGQDTVV